MLPWRTLPRRRGNCLIISRRELIVLGQDTPRGAARCVSPISGSCPSRWSKRTPVGVAAGFQHHPHRGPAAEVALERRRRGAQPLALDDVAGQIDQAELAVLVAEVHRGHHVAGPPFRSSGPS